MNSASAGQMKSSGVDTNADQICNKSIVIPNRIVTLANSFEKKDRSWYVKSQIPSDLSIQVDDITFQAHKFPLISKCGYISNTELQPSASENGYHLKLENFPGGAETFETILKFCYGLPLDLNPLNVASLRCASEYLYMTEEFEDGNLISKTDAFITFVVLASWRDTLTVLRSCANLSPWAENLQIVRRCCDLLAWKACNDDNIQEDVDSNQRCLYNDIATLQIDHFMRIITTVKARRAKPEIIGKIIMRYAENWLPIIDEDLEGIRGLGLGKNELQISVNRERTEESNVGCQEQKGIIESLVSVLPQPTGALSCHFLLRLLKTAIVYSASPALISDLEKRIGMALEDANVCDLLIPNFKNEDQQRGARSPEVYTIYNVDVVQRILEYFLMHEQQQQQQQVPGKPSITKLLDNYLAEIAKDPCLPITKFQVLAEALPESAWKCHDGLYRAIDMFLKTHPSLSEHDRRRLCKTMNCEKLSLDACLHAAQNDRLPLRTIVQINTQVLFSEQVKMRMMMQDKQPETKEENLVGGEDKRISRDNEIKTLEEELENVKKMMAELQNDYNELQQEYEKLSSKQKNTHNWGLRWQKMKKSFQIKREDDETRDTPRRRSSTEPRTSFRRRMSMS
ncbi:LOW QUALITY PROTEIN: BTB/POZ domain-containing protein DOT3 [Eutrema salsugineum]|uniref:LOW QUALITY PROTEIN: BTB/POZ domain-containing protein DOT3 n=1 Tax=Eutrema salsugineum TaxID=72664 RepID=UPI000CED5805|nr:LOW QUALITY PROTEIN: BTB/POZ domain-containing protein DOT3 [Eutrema salsugineum]